MNTFIKICGLRDAADVAAATDAGANAVGFVFAESVRRVTPAQAMAATESLPASVRKVAVMRHPDNDECRAVIEEFEPDVVQTDAEDFATLEIPAHIECWPVIREGRETVEAPDVYLYEGKNSGSGETVDWSHAARIAKHGRMILAGGLAEDNVRTAIQTVRPWGVDVSSGVESLPGNKDHELIRRFISAVRAAEKEV
ncbi:MAG: phosphoribosylanthranilate isomerase [Woeseiaceae bacterium]